VLALPGVGMFVQRRAVEPREAVLVLRKMTRHPVEDDAQARAMAGVHEQLEVLRRPEAAGRREESEHLIAPRPGERMLHDRQQLDVREAHVLHVRNETLGKLAVGEESIAVLRHPSPRAEMDLVDRHRPPQPSVVLAPRRHPVVVQPAVA
jgi:hypothetical protein